MVRTFEERSDSQEAIFNARREPKATDEQRREHDIASNHYTLPQERENAEHLSRVRSPKHGAAFAGLVKIGPDPLGSPASAGGRCHCTPAFNGFEQMPLGK